MYKKSFWIEQTIPEELFKKYEELLLCCNFKILNTIEHHFNPFGYTALFLLSESHLAIHTFPEHKKTYIELTSCVKSNFIKFIKEIK